MSISIRATMKFRVKGKSVDFRNREGSSPSIPTPKKAYWLPNHFSYLLLFLLVVQKSVGFSSILLFSISKRIWAEFFSLITSRMVYTIYVEMNTFEQGIPVLMIPNQYYCSYWNLQSLLFDDSRNEIPLPRLLIPVYFLIDIDPSHLVRWERCVGNGRDSSAGRAEDWKSSCHQFKSGSWHMINIYEYLSLQIQWYGSPYIFIYRSWYIHTYPSSSMSGNRPFFLLFFFILFLPSPLCDPLEPVEVVCAIQSSWYRTL